MDTETTAYGLEFDAEKHEYTYDGEKIPSVTEICEPITASKYKLNESVLRQAASRGTRIHELCQLMDLDMALIDDEDVEESVSGYLTAWIKFERDYEPTWWQTECLLHNDIYKYAGTADRIGVIDSFPVIVDIKTTSSLDRVSQIALATQLAGYCEAWNVRHTMKKSVSLRLSIGVQLKADGTYKVYRVSDIEDKYNFNSKELFMELLELRRFINYTK